MSSDGGGFSLDKMMKEMPKFFQMADDMHALTSYINDMRIIMIFLIVAGFVGGLVFLIIRRNKKKSKNLYRLTNQNNKGGDGGDEIDAQPKGWTKSAAFHAKNGQSETANGDRTLNL